MSSEVFTDSSMLEIFRAEVETHVEALTTGLLALERDPGDTSHIDQMMRGAHSIKGAARIVGIDPAVRVAHVMEDGFIAAQNGKLTLRPDHVDVLLRGVDLLSRLANASNDASIDWRQFESEATPLVAEISSVMSGAPPASASKPIPASPGQSAPSASPAAAKPKLDDDLTIICPAMLDRTAADVARRSLVSGLDAGAAHVRVDLSSTTDLDAIGLAFLAAIPDFVTREGRTSAIVDVSPELSIVLQATGVTQLYPGAGR